MNSGSTETFGVMNLILCDVIMVVTCHSAFEKTHRTYNIKVNPTVKSGLFLVRI